MMLPIIKAALHVTTIIHINYHISTIYEFYISIFREKKCAYLINFFIRILNIRKVVYFNEVSNLLRQYSSYISMLYIVPN